jgi:hypothetical protein
VLLFFKRVLVLDRAEQELEPEKPENPKIQKTKIGQNQVEQIYLYFQLIPSQETVHSRYI